ncbi:hypothetical protein [Anaerovibrio lipolyticus]|uniref:hypothetical protein n=1 Tax=Anaerovibrio lipolyticus TaxID=82374 RepID=UPI0026EEDD54|nr:hypothetical protein [Anaerovibrio lipolyticus]MBE6106870.1 hypothetical protein [Anaerovibrio lipolyticus]
MMKLKNENKLTDAELEQVAGGDALADDSRYLNVLLRGREGQCGRYGYWKALDHYREIVNAWASVGVEFEGDGEDFCYRYFINGKQVSQGDAWLHAEQVVGKHLKRADWDW